MESWSEVGRVCEILGMCISCSLRRGNVQIPVLGNCVITTMVDDLLHVQPESWASCRLSHLIPAANLFLMPISGLFRPGPQEQKMFELS